MWWIYMAVWSAVQLMVTTALFVAAHRNRSVRPQAAGWVRLVAVLQIASIAVTLGLTLLPWNSGALVQWDQPLEEMLIDPGTWAYIAQRWLYTVLPVVITLITTYVILEQPDAPQRQRPIEESAA